FQHHGLPRAQHRDLAMVEAADRDSSGDRLHVDPEAHRGALQHPSPDAARCDHARHGRSCERLLRLQLPAFAASTAATNAADKRRLRPNPEWIQNGADLPSVGGAPLIPGWPAYSLGREPWGAATCPAGIEILGKDRGIAPECWVVNSTAKK